MRRGEKSAAGVLAAAVIGLGGAGVANAVTSGAAGENVADGNGGDIAPAAIAYVGGGTWDDGTTGPNGGGTVYSDYHHGSTAQGSSVQNARGVVVRSPTVNAGSWSYARATAYPGEVDSAYWRVVG